VIPPKSLSQPIMMSTFRSGVLCVKDDESADNSFEEVDVNFREYQVVYIKRMGEGQFSMCACVEQR